MSFVDGDGSAQADGATDIVAALSLEQKAALLSGQDFWSTRPVEDLGVPSVVLTDGPHGVRRQVGGFDHLGLQASVPATCFPLAVAVGSSWDPEVARRLGAAVGREARALGVHVALGPGVNIKRSPLCGRNFEYYSEDPLLSGVLGAAHVRGQQGEGVGASVKHFAANNQETDRMQISAEVDERTLREIYFPAFERVVTEAAPATVMCSYNRINGVHASQHRWLLTDVLRDEWGFEGVVVSDWGAVHDPVAAIGAGLDLRMPGARGRGVRRVVEAVRSGALDEAAVDTAARRVLGLSTLAQAGPATFDVDVHHALARELASECIVLLKNDAGVLPVARPARIAVIGEFARAPRYQGAGSSLVNPTRLTAALDSLRAGAAGHGHQIDFSPGFSLDGAGDDAGAGDEDQLREEAVTVARAADVTVVFAGLGPDDESEGFDRTTLELPATQVRLIRAVAARSGPVIVVLANGGVVSLEGWHDDVEGIVEGFLLGQAGGAAIADVLFGDVNPSGHLAETIPLRLEDNPSYVNFPGELGQVRYGEGVMVGYRWYATTGMPVRYPFGHGLSYTTFATTDLTVGVTGPDTARATLTVTNTGDCAGKHVVQLYVSTTAGPVRRPARELRAFTKVHLEPGESRPVTFDLDARAFAFYDSRASTWTVSPGAYSVQICTDASEVVAASTIELSGDPTTTELTLDATLHDWLHDPVIGDGLLDRIRAELTDQQTADGITPELIRTVESMPMRTIVEMFGDALPAGTINRLMEASQAGRRR